MALGEPIHRQQVWFSTRYTQLVAITADRQEFSLRERMVSPQLVGKIVPESSERPLRELVRWEIASC
jgi:hypothetical protein